MDKYAPPHELWDAKKCTRMLGLRSVSVFKYRVKIGKIPAATHFEHGKDWWRADAIRELMK